MCIIWWELFIILVIMWLLLFMFSDCKNSMMALRRLLCLHNTFWLPPGHPAVRGLAPGLPRLNGRLGSLPCSSISPRHILTATACQKHSTTHNSIPTYGPKPGCSRLALNHYCPVMLQGHQGHRNTLPALIQSEYSSLLVQPGHKVSKM